MKTTEQIKFIEELKNEVHPTIAQWADELIEEEKMSIKEVKAAMQRIIDICERD